MSLTLRVILVVGACLALAVVVRSAKRERIRISDCIFWIVSAVTLVVLALFPGIAFFFSGLLGFLSPSNFVFVVVIALLLVKLFSLACDVSMLADKVNRLSEEVALNTHGGSVRRGNE